MMTLPWFRMDSNVASHDKILALLSDPSPRRWQAFTSWVCASGWSNGHGTDGRIPMTALPFVHANQATAELLVKYLLWEPVTGGYQIRNFDKRNPTASTTEAVRQAKAEGGQYGNHIRWHEKAGKVDATCPFCQQPSQGGT